MYIKVNVAISRAQDGVIIAGNTYFPYPLAATDYLAVTPAVAAAHNYALLNGGLVRLENNGIDSPLVSLQYFGGSRAGR